MDFVDVVKGRRSIRKFQDRDVPLQLVLDAVELAIWAPNSANLQPWRFFVVKDRATIEAMADAVQAKADLLASWPEAQEFGQAVHGFKGGIASFRSAPIVIGVAVGPYQNLADRIVAARGEADPDAKEVLLNRQGIANRAQIAASATAHLLLTLHSLGLGAFWAAGAMIARQELQRVLNVPEGMGLFTLVPVGFPAEVPAGARKPVEEVVQVI